LKLLLDTCLSSVAVRELSAAGQDVVWVGHWPEDPGDEEIFQNAQSEERTLITLDKDFGELAIVHGIRHCGIVRLVNFKVAQQASICLKVIELHEKELTEGAIVTAEPGRLRIRLFSD
jgi:predicted nuclease of predicted toxin-antitoxin system